ncbi:MAG: hypothetical protein GVY18_08970 [Bacteroidetes bacterium]|jgi:hypothetical protein|nr:hypothetical protein [Bacteroidota bacterium]
MVRILAVLFLGLGLCVNTASGQAFDLFQEATGGAYIKFAEPGDITIRVSVWGGVNTGLYEVTQGMHLSTLLTIAGGPPIGEISGRGGNQQRFGYGDFINEMTIKLMREEQGQWATIVEAQMEGEANPLPEDPVLQEGDLLIVETQSRRTFGWRDGLEILGSVGATVFLIDRLIEFARGGE